MIESENLLRKCNTCSEYKDVKDNFKMRNNKFLNRCIACDVIYQKQYYNKNKDILKEKSKEYYKIIKKDEEFKSKRQEYRDENKDKQKEYDKERRKKQKHILKEKSKEYYNSNKEIILSKSKEKYLEKIKDELYIDKQRLKREENKERINRVKREYYKNNEKAKNQKKKSDKLYILKRLKNDTLYKLKHNIASNIRISFYNKGKKKNSKTTDILGISIEEFMKYLESKFEHWMNWDNRGKYNGEINYGWDLDHIIPISTAKTEEDIIRLNHYTNFQPLCSYVNRYIKKNKLNFSKDKYINNVS
jgi:hypothetical protein